jgi:hypothetical protein
MRQQEAIINKKNTPRGAAARGSAARCAAARECGGSPYDNIRKGYGEGTAKYQ